MHRLAIIPARGGSKRIPRKNIKDFCGKPIMAYSIDLALNSGLFDEVMVSTDDQEIATIAKQYGANVPFLRSTQMADDFATIENVISEVLQQYQLNGKTYTEFCCLMPTSPLLKLKTLKDSYYIYKDNGYYSLIPVLRFSYPIQRALKLDDNKRLVMREPGYIHTRSQDVEPMFHDTGQFYWMDVRQFMTSKEIFCANSGYIELLETEVQDIDTEIDWQIAEIKFKWNGLQNE